MREGNPAPPGDSTLERLMAEADGLYRYALSRVRNHHTAQDLVQETLVTACRKMADFEGRSSLGTWLIGILRHKILDHLRRIERHPEVLGSLPMGEQGEDPGDEWFTRYGAWRLDPNAGLDLLDTDPHQLAERAEIRAAVQECLNRLPDSLRRVFVLREVEDCTTPEICAKTGITRGSLPVLLHRARQLLRICLQKGWLNQ